MQEVRKPVDDGDLGVPRELDERAMTVGAGHDAVHPAVQVAGDVAHRLAHAPADVVLAEEDGVTAQLGHGDVERGARPERLLLEDHGEGLVLHERRPRPVLPGRLELYGAVDQARELVPAQVGQGQEVATGKTRDA
ncbi:MAG TPA: hypothetical protein PLU66_10210 [Trueperaceae bacterium]|nr:hypothetical protein [Trueperaceae bacterium]